MALFAKSERFPTESCTTDLGPGDYNPPTPKPNSAGAVSLGFTGPKGLPNSIREQAVEDTNLSPRTSAARLRRTSAATTVGRRPSLGGSRSIVNAAVARVGKLEAEQLGKQLTWSEREREKLQNEIGKFRQREVRTLITIGIGTNLQDPTSIDLCNSQTYTRRSRRLGLVTLRWLVPILM